MCVIRFFKINVQGNKNLFHREVRPDLTIEQGLALASQIVAKTRDPEIRGSLLCVEVGKDD